MHVTEGISPLNGLKGCRRRASEWVENISSPEVRSFFVSLYEARVWSRMPDELTNRVKRQLVFHVLVISSNPVAAATVLRIAVFQAWACAVGDTIQRQR